MFSFATPLSLLVVLAVFSADVAGSDDVVDAPTKRTSAEEEELKLLSGVWVFINRESGLRHEPSRFCTVLQVDETGEVVKSSFRHTRNTWESTYGFRWKVNPTAMPRQLDSWWGSNVQLGVYELTDDRLYVYSKSGQEASESRPDEAALKRLDPRVYRTTYVRGLDAGRKILAHQFADALTGAWRVTAIPGDNVHWSGVTSLVVKDSAFQFTRDDKEFQVEFSLNPLLEENLGAGVRIFPGLTGGARTQVEKEPLKPFSPLHIDLTIDGVIYQGVFDFPESPMRFSYFPDKPTERPGEVGAEGAVTVKIERLGKP